MTARLQSNCAAVFPVTNASHHSRYLNKDLPTLGLKEAMLHTEYIGLSVAFSIMVLMDLFGNTMVVLVVLLNKSMRTPMNRLMLNLALADMVVALFVAIQFVIGPEYQHPSGTTGSFLCKFITGGCMMWTAAMVSICNLVVISVER